MDHFIQNNINANINKISKNFWEFQRNKANNVTLHKNTNKLPLARIKRMMKIEESIKMVSQEVPYIFGIAAQVFIEEITIRAWIYTKESNRKIITADDVIKALKNTSKYDFLYFLLIEDNQKL